MAILMAEDDDDDFELAMEAFKEANLLNPVKRVINGEELMNYLLMQGSFKDSKNAPRPFIILLDLNMPKKNGLEALKEIKDNPNLANIPIVILTTSRAEEDIIKSYTLGVNSFIRKPIKFDDLIRIVRVFKQYWLEVVEVPHQFRKPDA